jgi:hypothetical protein
MAGPIVRAAVGPLITAIPMLAVGAIGGPYSIVVMVMAVPLLIVPSAVLHVVAAVAGGRLTARRSSRMLILAESTLWGLSALIGVTVGSLLRIFPRGMTLETSLAMAWAYFLVPAALVGVIVSCLYERGVGSRRSGTT